MLHGALSTEISDGAAAVGGLRALRRSGFCGMRTQASPGCGVKLSAVAVAGHSMTLRVRRRGRKNSTWSRSTRSSFVYGCAYMISLRDGNTHEGV